MTTGSLTWKTEATYWVRIYVAGDIQTAKQALREECLREGLCVTVEPCDFIFTGGEEAGFVVGLLNYPRFPTQPDVLIARAKLIAQFLMERCCQFSALVVTRDQTEWLSRYKEART
jgi:hypothetical protein